MHPALSVIFFTAVSGIGYGLLFLIGLVIALDPLAPDPLAALLAIATGAVFAAAGLTSSTLHLGQPQRAWRAFSQWRSSWLSREGVAALCSFAPMLALGALVWRFADALAAQTPSADATLGLRITGLAMAIAATVTVFCTARIYTSLKTIAAWHNGYVLPTYLLLGLLGAAAWLWMLDAIAGARSAAWLRTALPGVIIALAGASWLLKRAYWRFIDSAPSASTPETATGLGRFGTVRGVEAPHTEENYLTREMGFVLARKHSARLRRFVLLALALPPVALALLALLLPLSALVIACAAAVALCVTAATFVERWLFFAEAKHVVMLYYAGARAPAER
ncbi:MAG TPA: DmsC/YnfH family molybdoenzyme membrane anchor subunit [Rudaea sp.]|jgi:DMSO reductase anchor subunit